MFSFYDSSGHVGGYMHLYTCLFPAWRGGSSLHLYEFMWFPVSLFSLWFLCVSVRFCMRVHAL